MSCRKRINTKWNNIPGFSRKNSHKNKNRSRGRSRRREAKKIFKPQVIKHCNPLSSIKKSTSTLYTSRSSQLSYPTLPREESLLQNSSTSVTQRSSTPVQLSPYSVPGIDLTNDDDSCPPTPTPASRRLRSNSWTSREYQYIAFKDPIEEVEIESKIYKRLIEGPGKLGSSSPLGHVYCALRKETPGYTKIGSAEKDPSARVEQLSPNRRFGTLTHTTSALFTHFRLVERVIHLELWNQRKESKIQDRLAAHTYELSERKSITGSTKQNTESGKTEWFHIEASYADEVRDKWVTWSRQHNPYYQNGELSSFWKNWFKRQIDKNPYHKATHGSLHLRWEALLNPTRSEICCHHLAELWAVAEKCYYWAMENPRTMAWVILSCLICALVYEPRLPRILRILMGFGMLLDAYFFSRYNSDTKMKR